MVPLLELEHLFASLKGFIRPLWEGREIINNLIYVRVRESDDCMVEIEALTVRTTKIQEVPVKIEVSIGKKSKEIDKTFSSISYTCPAGASHKHCCKHAMATLIYLEK